MKQKLLCWCDSPTAGTGFGTVSKYVLKALSSIFDIDVLAINYTGDFVDKEKLPYQLVPAKLNNPQDPYGNQMFVNSMLTGKYDFVWIMNDTFVVHKLGKEINKVLDQLREGKLKVPTIVYYFPVDCKVLANATGMLEAADHVVAYCQFGKDEALKTMPSLQDKLSVITHGVDKSSFRKINPIERKAARQQLFKVIDDNTFIWINANRNSGRKDIARTILAFSEFKKSVPNSRLYLHTAIKDTTIDLSTAVQDLNLSLRDDVIFPGNGYGAHRPFPIEVLNAFYNSCDAFITTTLGEGWGLTHLDAATIEMPIVAPNNTCFPEQLDNGNRGYLYPCKERVWVDNSGYRPFGSLDDIVNTMHQCYEETISKRNLNKISAARQYIDTITWDKIGIQWVDLFKKLQQERASGISKSKIVGVSL